jgi:2-keto-4-pentenoate hydratase/2-oxohepta-3-ene-1,7-dioic acid hydratase in catechol pathway
MGIPALIAYASRFYTLFPGDVLLTGTPEGVGPVHAGDVIAASIGHIGSMTIEVRADC